MNEVSLIESGFLILWECRMHKLKGRALGKMGESFADFEAALEKNFCPQCSQNGKLGTGLPIEAAQ